MRCLGLFQAASLHARPYGKRDGFNHGREDITSILISHTILLPSKPALICLPREAVAARHRLILALRHLILPRLEIQPDN
jgi:hypothetical protein